MADPNWLGLRSKLPLFHACSFRAAIAIGPFRERPLLGSPVALLGFEAQQPRINVREQLLMHGLTEHSVVKSINTLLLFHHQQVTSRPAQLLRLQLRFLQTQPGKRFLIVRDGLLIFAAEAGDHLGPGEVDVRHLVKLAQCGVGCL